MKTWDGPGDSSSRQREAAPSNASFTGHSGSRERPKDEREHLLVVDDEASIRLSLHRFFSRLGYRVSTARDGYTALAVLDEEPWVDLVVTDLVMPDYDGRQLILDMRAKHPSPAILVISGFPAALLPDPGPDGKPVPFLSKPFSLEVLAAEVRRLLDERARRQTSD